MKLKLVDLVPLKEIDVNDPALMRARAAKDQMSQIKPNPRIGFDQALDLRGEKQDLERQISNLYREMESDPDVEAEGGEVADQYGDTLNRLEARLYKINKQIASYDMSEGEDEDDEQDMADVKADIDSMINESEDKWNAIDVSRKAEKEVDNKEWNSRTTKKLDMLKALNKAGKFKKDWGEEKLQGWVDQNYSWEKLSRQFKLNESINEEEKMTPQKFAIQFPDIQKYDEYGSWNYSKYYDDDGNLRNPYKISGPSWKPVITLSKKGHEDEEESRLRAKYGNNPRTIGNPTQHVDQDYDVWIENKKSLNESKNNKIKGKLLTERFQELAGIKPLYEADPEAIKGKHYPDEETVKKLRKGPYASGGQNAHLKEMIKKVVNLKMDSEVGEPVTVEYDPTKNLQDVTISWGNESHTVDFEPGDEIDNHGNEGSDIETIANSDDGRWQFILDVYVGYQFDMTGDYEEWDFDELIVQGHPENEDHLDPEDRFDQDPMEEGSCGYGPDGVPGDTPGETKGMPADTRTMTMMRESIRKEIKRLHENK